MKGRPDQPTRPAGSAVRGQRMRLPVERTGNDPPIHNPAVHHQPGQRAVQLMVLAGPSQPAAASCVVHNRPAAPGDGDPRAGTSGARQQLHGRSGRTRLGGHH
eukprot:13243947-Alexandrium_andersonii.AAC.1